MTGIQRRDFVLAGAAATALSGTSALAAGEPVVETAQGKLRGARADGVYRFRGVRYGEPTGGANRFRPPVKPKPWTGVRDALEYGESSLQLRIEGQVQPPLFGFLADPAGTRYGEDCLVLNVWTPALDNRKRPVMVWYHGGGYTVGSGSRPGYDGASLARTQDVVVVTVNHRLNALGFCGFDALGVAGYDKAGNVGLMDCVAALEWVHQNIAGFGGDTGRVTIFGESGGGSKVSHLLAMPSAKGLFHRAAVQSGSSIRTGAKANSARSAQMLLTELGLTRDQGGELAKIPMDRLNAAMSRVGAKGGGRGLAPWLDGEVIPRHPFDPDAPSVSADVPMLIGYCQTEETVFQFEDSALFTLDEAGLRQRMAKIAGGQSDAVIKAYQADFPKANPVDLYFIMATDLRGALPPAVQAGRKAAAGKAPAWLFRFDRWATAEGGKMRAGHTSEIPFVFNNMHLPIVKQCFGDAPDYADLGAKVSAAWAAFARDGVPKARGLPDWRPYGPSKATMLFNTESRCVDDPNGAARALLASAAAKAA